MEHIFRKCVACYGLQRKIATYATGSVTVTGTTGTILPAGSKVAAGNVMFTINDTVTVGEDGTVSAPVICDTAGTQGNVLAGYINRFPVTINGLTKVTNTHATTGAVTKKRTQNCVNATKNMFHDR